MKDTSTPRYWCTPCGKDSSAWGRGESELVAGFLPWPSVSSISPSVFSSEFPRPWCRRTAGGCWRPPWFLLCASCVRFLLTVVCKTYSRNVRTVSCVNPFSSQTSSWSLVTPPVLTQPSLWHGFSVWLRFLCPVFQTAAVCTTSKGLAFRTAALSRIYIYRQWAWLSRHGVTVEMEGHQKVGQDTTPVCVTVIKAEHHWGICGRKKNEIKRNLNHQEHVG